jgi:26S proteasome regulatory subunit N10
VEVDANSGAHLADVIVSSSILGGGSAGAVGSDEFGGFDPNMDPELAMAIRLSMEEERQRQGAAAASEPAGPPAAVIAPAEDDFDAELRAALLASLHENPEQPVEEMEMDEEVRKALAESMEDWEGGSEPKKPKKDEK